MADTEQLTRCVTELGSGTPGAAEKIIPALVGELREVAGRLMRGERADHTLQPTALVNELYLRLVDSSQVSWRGRAQFLALAAVQMRRILVDSARRRLALRRGGDAGRVTLVDIAEDESVGGVDLLALDDALAALETRSPRQCRVVELRYFAGLTIEEVAAALDVAASTVKDDWAVARAFLHRELSRGES